MRNKNKVVEYIKSKFILLGNGFSIDLINKIEKTDKINLINLFAKGDEVYFPKTQEKGFLSAKYCPNLWMLGVNSTIDNSLSNQFINNIITCANVYNLSKKSLDSAEADFNTYLKAYFELSSYLRYLFIHYNNLIGDDILKEASVNIPLIKYIKQAIADGFQINIITYNYDIWLERLLHINDLDFSISAFDDTKKKIDIFKPHGSISFSFKTKLSDSAPYKIKFTTDDIAQEIKDFDILYEFSNDHPLVNSIIPPAGDSNRYPYGWISEIRKNLTNCVECSQKEDELVIYGISYWHVDRNEIDEILINIDSSINIKYINPVPPPDFNAVLYSLFKKYIHYTDGNLLI